MKLHTSVCAATLFTCVTNCFVNVVFAASFPDVMTDRRSMTSSLELDDDSQSQSFPLQGPTKRLRRDSSSTRYSSVTSTATAATADECLSLTETCRTAARDRPVCGSDGRTYRSKCELKRTRRCSINDSATGGGPKFRLVVVSRGRCTNSVAHPQPSVSSSTLLQPPVPSYQADKVGGGVTSRCVDERRAAIKLSQSNSRSSSSGDSSVDSHTSVNSPPATDTGPLRGTSPIGGSVLDVYIPVCRPDGRYADVQCHNATGYCWCVAPDSGRPIPGSSVSQGRRPTDCASRLRRRHQHRESTAYGATGGRVVIKRRRGVNLIVKDCTLADRSTFNTNLVKLFIDEYQRAPKPLHQQRQLQQQLLQQSLSTIDNHATAKGLNNNNNQGGTVGVSASGSSNLVTSADSSSTVPAPSSLSSELRRSAVDWKFSELDVGDVDGQLDRKELKTLRYLVNKLVKPRPCARTFISRCDDDADRRLSRLEWISCFDVDSGGSGEDRQNEEGQDVIGGLKTSRAVASGTDPSGRLYVYQSSSSRHHSSARQDPYGGSSAMARNPSTGGSPPRSVPRLHPSHLRPSGGGGRRGSKSSARIRTTTALSAVDAATDGRLATSGRRTATRGQPLTPGNRASASPGTSAGSGSGVSSSTSDTQSFLALINSKVSARYHNRSGGRVDHRTSDHALDNNAARGARRHNTAHSNSLSPSTSARSTCEAERIRAIDLDRVDPNGHIFVPECEPGGTLYRRAQCHNSTGYCWCVDQRTGVPIPGISTHKVAPNCTDVNVTRLDGCPSSARRRFLTDLLDRLTQEMVDTANNGSVNSRLGEPDPEQSIEERAVRWKLSTLDVNHNNVLEQSELEPLKNDLRLKRQQDRLFARKCRRNFLHYCDEDSDSRITLDEWVNCTGLNDQPKNLPENLKRRGPNPFSTVLKS